MMRAIPRTINNLGKSSTRQSSFRLGWLLQGAGIIACILGFGLFDTPKSLAAGVSVSGQVFSDTNSNGLIDTGDSGIANVTIVLHDTTANTCQSVSTNSSGNYNFTNVLAGNYEIIEAATQTTPTPSTCTPAGGKTLAQTIGKDPTGYASTTPNVIPITVSTIDLTGENFGDHLATSLGNCPNPAYITQGTAANTIKLNTLNLSTGQLSSIAGGDVLTSMNGIGFNLVDGYIYGSQNASGNFNLLRTGLDGKLENLGNVLDVSGKATTALQGGSFVGDVDQNGIFYSIQGSTINNIFINTVTAIDVNPNSPTFKRYLKTFTLSSSASIQDIAISPIDGKVYTIDNSTASRLYRYPDFSTILNGGIATVEDLGLLQNVTGGGNMASGPKGAIYFAADGTLYAYSNGNSNKNNGEIYALSTTNISTPPKFITITTSATGVSFNDGARCMFAAPVALPNTYTASGTLYRDSNNNGVNNNEPGLAANVKVSIYEDKNNNNIIDANEQITTTTSDVNGLYTLSNLSAGTYKIKVDTSNVNIPSGYRLKTSNDLSITVGSSNITGKDFGFAGPASVLLLKRITAINGVSTGLTTTLVDPLWPTGYVVGGTDGGKVKPGDTIEYTIYFHNTGGRNAKSARICDFIRPNQTFQPNTYSVGKGMQLVIGASNNTPTFLTNANDTVDRSQFIAANGTIPTGCNLLPATITSIPNGMPVLDLVRSSTDTTSLPSSTTFPFTATSGTADSSYGFWRFTTKVNP